MIEERYSFFTLWQFSVILQAFLWHDVLHFRPQDFNGGSMLPRGFQGRLLEIGVYIFACTFTSFFVQRKNTGTMLFNIKEQVIPVL